MEEGLHPANFSLRHKSGLCNALLEASHFSMLAARTAGASFTNEPPGQPLEFDDLLRNMRAAVITGCLCR